MKRYLGGIGALSIFILSQVLAWSDDASTARELALDLGNGHRAELTEFLSSPDPMARRYAIYGLQMTGDPEAGVSMHPLLKDDVPAVQLAAIEAIGKLGDVSAVDSLLPLLESDDLALRFQTLMALGRIGEASSAPAMTKAMTGRQLWLELPTWDALCLFNVIGKDFYTDTKIKEVLYNLLDYPSWDHPQLADMEPTRREALIGIIPHRAAVTLARKFKDPSGEAFILKGFAQSPFDQQISAIAAEKLKLASALPGLEKMLQSKWHNNRLQAIRTMGNISDKRAIPVLTPLLENEDSAIRETAACALEQIDGKEHPLTITSKAAEIPTDNYPEVPGDKCPPQFIILGVDDCSSIEGLEAMVDICRTLDELGSKAVFTMWVAPLAGAYEDRDIEKEKYLLQILFDYGCEFANHTLHHNPGGRNWHSLGQEAQIEELEGCTAWLKDNIDGFIRPFTIKYGGGGMGDSLDKTFTNNLVRKQGFLYTGERGQHPNEQKWPYEKETFMAKYVLETGCLDGNAPPVHADITNPIVSDYPGRFDFEMEDGLKMWVANFDYNYRLPHRPVLAVNAFHDWGMKTPESLSSDYYSNRNEGALLKAFLIDVLVTNRDKYPETHCVTFRQVLEYSLTDGNLAETLALGNGQDSR